MFLVPTARHSIGGTGLKRSLFSERLSASQVQRSFAERSLPGLSLVFNILNQVTGNKSIIPFGYQTMRQLKQRVTWELYQLTLKS